MFMLKKTLLATLLASLCIGGFSQQTSQGQSDAIQAKIKKVENSLSPLVLKKGMEKWNLQDQMEKYNIPGLSIAVINDYKIEWAKGYGKAKSNESKSVTTETVFQAASMSKFVNAIGLMKLRDDIQFDLDTDINTLLSSWKFNYDESMNGHPITTRQLLNHTAGLSIPSFGGYKNSKNLPDIHTILDGKKPANSKRIKQAILPNTRFMYCGGGTMISQLILMDLSGSPYESYIRKNLFEPLKMSNSFYSIEKNRYKSDIAYAHSYKGTPLKQGYNIYPESAAAGLWTNPTDLAKLIISVQKSLEKESNALLPYKSAVELISPSSPSSNAALGLFQEQEQGIIYLQHSGATRGYRSKCYFSSQNGNGVVIMLNGTDTKILGQVIRSVADVYGWPGFTDYEASPSLDLRQDDLKKFIGTYTFEKRKLQISLKKGKLTLSEKRKFNSSLTALDHHLFVINNISPKATVEFIKDGESTKKCIIKQGSETIEWVKSE